MMPSLLSGPRAGRLGRLLRAPFMGAGLVGMALTAATLVATTGAASVQAAPAGSGLSQAVPTGTSLARTPSHTPTPTHSPTHTLAPTHSPTPSATHTLAPTHTATPPPTHTATATPTVTPTRTHTATPVAQADEQIGTLSIQAGHEQVGRLSSVGGTLTVSFLDLEVTVEDAEGHRVPGVDVTFHCAKKAGGEACVSVEPQTDVRSDTLGVARFGPVELQAAANHWDDLIGSYSLEAVGPENTVTFTLDVPPLPTVTPTPVPTLKPGTSGPICHVDVTNGSISPMTLLLSSTGGNTPWQDTPVTTIEEDGTSQATTEGTPVCSITLEYGLDGSSSANWLTATFDVEATTEDGFAYRTKASCDTSHINNVLCHVTGGGIGYGSSLAASREHLMFTLDVSVEGFVSIPLPTARPGLVTVTSTPTRTPTPTATPTPTVTPTRTPTHTPTPAPVPLSANSFSFTYPKGIGTFTVTNNSAFAGAAKFEVTYDEVLGDSGDTLQLWVPGGAGDAIPAGGTAQGLALTGGVVTAIRVVEVADVSPGDPSQGLAPAVATASPTRSPTHTATPTNSPTPTRTPVPTPRPGINGPVCHVDVTNSYITSMTLLSSSTGGNKPWQIQPGTTIPADGGTSRAAVEGNPACSITLAYGLNGSTSDRWLTATFDVESTTEGGFAYRTNATCDTGRLNNVLCHVTGGGIGYGSNLVDSRDQMAFTLVVQAEGFVSIPLPTPRPGLVTITSTPTVTPTPTMTPTRTPTRTATITPTPAPIPLSTSAFSFTYPEGIGTFTVTNNSAFSGAAHFEVAYDEVFGGAAVRHFWVPSQVGGSIPPGGSAQAIVLTDYGAITSMSVIAVGPVSLAEPTPTPVPPPVGIDYFSADGDVEAGSAAGGYILPALTVTVSNDSSEAGSALVSYRDGAFTRTVWVPSASGHSIPAYDTASETVVLYGSGTDDDDSLEISVTLERIAAKTP